MFWYAEEHRICTFAETFFQIRDDLAGSTLVDLFEILLESSLWCKVQDDQYRLTRAFVLLAPLLALGSKCTSLSSGIHIWAQVLRYDLFSSVVFLPYFSILILSLPLLWLGCKSISLSSGFCVCRPGQYNMICWELILISGFFAFLWLIVWGMESINVAGILQEAGDADWRAYTRSQV